LIAAAGELAIELGVLPWSKGEATEAAEWGVKQWLTARGKAPIEELQAIAKVRRFIEVFGESRFDPLIAPTDRDGEPVEDAVVADLDRKVAVRAGYRKGEGERRRWHVWPEVWRTDVCDGLDPEAAGAALAKRGMLERGEGRNLAKKVKVGTQTLRFYTLTPKLFEQD
jgi:uncharacterized protein (DUF927 family)